MVGSPSLTWYLTQSFAALNVDYDYLSLFKCYFSYFCSMNAHALQVSEGEELVERVLAMSVYQFLVVVP